MATWQFDFHLIPASSVDRHFHTTPVAIGQQDYDAVPWWNGFGDGASFEDDLSKLLPAAPSWQPGTQVWDEEEGDRLDLTRDGHTVAEVYGRIDVRVMSLPFLHRLLDIARKHRLLIVTAEDRHLLRPSMKELLAAIYRSKSFAFVSDPQGFLRELANTD